MIYIWKIYEMENSELINLIKLMMVPQVSSTRLRNLVKYFGNPSNVFKAGIKQLKEVPGIDIKIAQNIFASDGEVFALEQMNKSEKEEIKIISFWDDEYPEYLKNILYPPTLLFCKGDTCLLNNNCIGIVGTRNPSQYGAECAKYFTSKICCNTFTIVSGLAHGIDTIAHNTTLENNGKTIAVLGCGVDIVYPKENKELYKNICNVGLVLSEYYIGSEPNIKNFPARNRIISGLSKGVILIESDINGGGMITAGFALDQNREVYAVPGPINSRKSKGTNKLIKEGRAKLLQNADDLLADFNLKTSKTEKSKDNLPLNLSLVENKIYSVLGSGIKHIDDIIEESGISISEILVSLTNLELKGIIRQMPGKLFEIVE
jgi:DNA processing protein